MRAGLDPAWACTLSHYAAQLTHEDRKREAGEEGHNNTREGDEERKKKRYVTTEVDSQG